jgi:hypothetical protein
MESRAPSRGTQTGSLQQGRPPRCRRPSHYVRIGDAEISSRPVDLLPPTVEELRRRYLPLGPALGLLGVLVVTLTRPDWRWLAVLVGLALWAWLLFWRRLMRDGEKYRIYANSHRILREQRLAIAAKRSTHAEAVRILEEGNQSHQPYVLFLRNFDIEASRSWPWMWHAARRRCVRDA